MRVESTPSPGAPYHRLVGSKGHFVMERKLSFCSCTQNQSTLQSPFVCNDALLEDERRQRNCLAFSCPAAHAVSLTPRERHQKERDIREGQMDRHSSPQPQTNEMRSIIIITISFLFLLPALLPLLLLSCSESHTQTERRTHAVQ